MRARWAGSLTRAIGKRTGRYVLVLLVLSWVLSAVESGAQNLLLNAGFDGSLASWSTVGVVGNGNQIHDPAEDVAGNAASGAAELSLTVAAPAGAQSGIRQCVAVTAGQTYHYGTRMKFPLGQASGAVQTFIEVEFFSTAGCGSSQNAGEGEGTLLGTGNYPLSDTAWYGIPGTVPTSGPGVVVAPVGAQSAMVLLVVERASGAQAAQALFDNAFFGVGLIPVELQGFVVE